MGILILVSAMACVNAVSPMVVSVLGRVTVFRCGSASFKDSAADLTGVLAKQLPRLTMPSPTWMVSIS